MPLLRKPDRAAFLPFFACALFLLASCATRPRVQDDGLLFSVLPAGSQVYLRFPMAQNEDFAKVLLRSAFPDMEEETVSKLLGRLGTVYAAASGRSVHASASGSFPGVAMGFVLTRKNGWRKIRSGDIPVTGKYYLSEATGFQLAFPSSSMAVAGSDVVPMLSAFGSYEPLPDGSAAGLFFRQLEAGRSADIGFYVGKLSELLPSLDIPGLKLEFPFGDASGVLCAVSSGDGPAYQLDATVKLTDPRTVRAAVAALRIVSRTLKVPFSVEQSGGSAVRVHGLTLAPDSVGKLVARIINDKEE